MNKKKKGWTGLLFLPLVWILAFGNARVEGSESCTITISNSTDGYTYEAYQIFAGTFFTDPDTQEKILSDITWGSGITEAGIAALEGKYQVSGAEEVAQKLSGAGQKAEEFALLAGENLSQPAGRTNVCTDDGYVITVPESGYYLVKNSRVPGTGGAYTAYILQVAGNIRVSPKSDLPSCDKKVEEDNDSDEGSPTLGTTADCDIGDTLNFTLTATLPENFKDYKTYSLYFHDTLCDGLTFDGKSVRAFVFTPGKGTFPVSESCYWIASEAGNALDDGCTFEVQFGDLNLLTGADDGSAIPVLADSVLTVTYSAVLNEKAQIGDPGNPNTLTIGYSDNPYDKSSMNQTPPVEVVVFTYELVLHKVDEGKKPLKGAAFELYKYYAAPDRWEKTEGLLQTSEEETKFTFAGLDAGRYKLVEKRVPDGYNRMEDFFFTVEAVQKEDTASASGFSTILNVFATDQEGNPLSDAGDVFTIGQSGSFKTNIVNRKGSILPGTGGAGAGIFCAAGVLLLAGAAFLFFRMRRGNRFAKIKKKD